MSELKPCPFCGGEAREWNNGSMEPIIDENGAYVDMLISSLDMFGIECERCFCQNIGYATEIEAIKAWNKRITFPDCESAERNGDKCLGYGKSEHDDEPCDACKTCSKQSSYGDE